MPYLIPGFAVGVVFSLATTLIGGAGLVGLMNSVSGLKNKDFSWGNFAKNIAAGSIVALLTFGSGYASGAITGLILLGKDLTDIGIKIIGSTAGSLVNTGVNTGCYVVKTYLEGESPTALSLIMRMGSGAWGGCDWAAAGYADYLTVEVTTLNAPSIVLGAEKLSSQVDNKIVKVYEYTRTS